MTPPSEPDRRAVWGAGIVACTLVPVLHHLRYGYRFGYSDQDEFLPWLLSRLDAQLMTSDWLVGLQAGAFNVRSGFVGMLELPAGVLGIEGAVLAVHAAAWMLLGWATWDVARRVAGGPIAGLAATLAALVLIPRWTLGGNAMASPMLVPSLVAWALVMSALSLRWRDRGLAAGVCVGVAAWIQLLVAFHAGLALLVAGLAAGSTQRRATVRCAVAALLIATPVAVLLADAGNGAPPVPTDPPLFAIMAWFRAPHHYAAAAFPPGDWVRFGTLFLVGAGALAWTIGGRRARDHAFLVSVFSLSLLAVALGWFGTAARPSVTMAALQPFKQTVLSAPLLMAVLAGLAGRFVRRFTSRVPRWPVGAWVAISLLAAGFGTFMIPVTSRPSEALLPAAEWAERHTARSDLFAIPPSSSGFAYRSRRSVLVTFKAWAFQPADMHAWLRRLQDVAPGAAEVPSGLDEVSGVAPLAHRLDGAWESLTPAYLDRLSDRYDVRYVVRRTALENPGPRGHEVAAFDRLFVYRWDPPSHASPNGAAPAPADDPGEAPYSSGGSVRTDDLP